MNSTPEQLFGIQYNANADAVTAGFIDQSSDDMLAKVIAGVPSMTTGQYTRLAAAKLGIDPMVLSPQLTAAKDTIKLAEHHIYGSSRLGIQNYDTSTLMNTYDQSASTNTGFAMSAPAVWYSYLYGDVISRSYKEPWGHGDNGRWSVNRTLGKRYYELTDHLGNVLATVMDRKTGHVNSSIPTLYDYYNPDVVSATDYYPGGMPMGGRYINGDKTPNGYNGQRRDDEVYGAGNLNSALFWEYDTRLNRRWNMDPVVKSWESSYATFRNNSVTYADPHGDNVKLHDQAKADGSDIKDYVKKDDIQAVGDYKVIGLYENKDGYAGKLLGYDAYKNGRLDYEMQPEDLEGFKHHSGYYSLAADLYNSGSDNLKQIGIGIITGDVGAVKQGLKNENIAAWHDPVFVTGILLATANAGITFCKSPVQVDASETVSRNLRKAKQMNQHTAGGNQTAGKSYLSSYGDAQKLLDAVHRGETKILKIDASQNRIYVEYRGVTGTFVNKGVETPSNRFMIKGTYSGGGATIVPVNPMTNP